jgi:hypothetical protein
MIQQFTALKIEKELQVCIVNALKIKPIIIVDKINELTLAGFCKVEKRAFF